MAKPAEVTGILAPNLKRGAKLKVDNQDKFPWGFFAGLGSHDDRGSAHVHWWKSKLWAFVVYPAGIDSGNSRMLYPAVKLRWFVDTKEWRVLQVVWLRSRWRAKDQAWKWFCKSENKAFKSLHYVSDKQKARGLRLKELREERIVKDPMDPLFAAIRRGETHDSRPELDSGDAGKRPQDNSHLF